MQTLTDGRLPSSPGTLYQRTADSDTLLTIVCGNTSATLTETVLFTVTRSGSTARRLARAVLAPNEGFFIRGVPLSTEDLLSGQATDGGIVDYVVSEERSDAAPLQAFSLAADGSKKQVSSGISGNQTISGTLTVGGSRIKSIGAPTAAAGSTHSDAAALPAGTAEVYPVTASNGTKGVILTASDQVTGRTVTIGNEVSTQPLIVYPPSGGTINGAAADAGFTGVTGAGVEITCLSGSGNTWLAR